MHARNIIIRFCFLMVMLLSMGIANGVKAQGVVPDAVERAALLALYNSTDGAHWLSKWKLTQVQSYPDSANLLAGITVTGGDVTAISLSSNWLNGSIPEELNNLVALQYLYLGSDIRFPAYNITGTIPDLSALVNLKSVNFSNHSLTGPIPAWLGTSWTKVTQLNLNARSRASCLTGPIPENIQNLTGLVSADFSANDLGMNQGVPDSLRRLKELQWLSLSNCSLNYQDINIGLTNLPTLYTLNLSFNNGMDSAGFFPNRLRNLPSLLNLILDGTTVHNFLPIFKKLSTIQMLTMNNSDFSDPDRLSSVIDTLKTLPVLTTLQLQYCSIDSLASDFVELSTVKNLFLSHNDFTPEECNELGYMPSLTNLYIQYCNLTAFPSSLVESTTLREIWAGYNPTLKNIPPLVKDIQHLKVLELQSTSLDSIPVWFGTGYLDGLESLILDRNRIKTVPLNFRELKSLRNLSISYNQLNGNWPAFYDSLKNMESINLSFNPRLDVLPDMTTWTKLTRVDLQYDSLFGAIPKYLTSATSPKQVVIINNNLYDNISAGAQFKNSPFVHVGSNRLTFEDILPLHPDFTGNYFYSPQPKIDKQRNVYAYPGGYAIFVAHVDTLAALQSTFQWYKVGSSAPVSPVLNSKTFQLNGILAGDNNAKFYYIIRNPNAPNLTLTSEVQTLIISCQAAISSINFKAKRYVCAMNFKPTMSYVANECRNVSYLWSFGDGGTSTEKSPWHAYASNGTYSVSLKVNFACGPCSADSTFTKSVTYNLASQSEMVRDSTIQVSTTDALDVLSVSAATFSDAWPLQLPADVSVNGSFRNGTQGVWRNDGMYVYDVPRAKSSQTRTDKDGTFTMDRFNWELAEADAIPHWTQANAMTQYSPYSYELENRDVLGIYSAALYDYGGHLPSANGVNMRNDEMAFTGFEYTKQATTGNLIFTNTPLPAYDLYKVVSAVGHVAVVEATLDQLYNVQFVDVSAKGWLSSFLSRFKKTNYIPSDEVICMQPHPTNEKWSILVLRREPFEGSWTGQIKVKNIVEPFVTATIDSVVTAHTGRRSMRINAATSFKQQLLHLDSGKTYFINAWVSINNTHLLTPSLGNGINITPIFKNRDNVTVLSATLEPSGAIINGWQQIRGSFTLPDKRLQLELKFDNGSASTVWFDDIRVHPDKGNMKSYVYNLKDYRLSAVLDEENFATLYFYDEEGNLHLVKKETARGIKTISENVSYQIERN